MKISEWLKEMQQAGFEGDFKATDGQEKYVGKLTKDGIKAQRVKSKEESRAEFLKMKETISK